MGILHSFTLWSKALLDLKVQVLILQVRNENVQDKVGK